MSKFVFTKSLSDILSLITELGEENNLNVHDLSFVILIVLKSLFNYREYQQNFKFFD